MVRNLTQDIKRNRYACTKCPTTFDGSTNKLKEKRIRVHVAQHFVCYLCECGYTLRVRDTLAAHFSRRFRTGHRTYYRVDQESWGSGEAREHIKNMPHEFLPMPDQESWHSKRASPTPEPTYKGEAERSQT